MAKKAVNDALKKLSDAATVRDDDDTSWNDALPEAPPLPQKKGDVTAVFRKDPEKA